MRTILTIATLSVFALATTTAIDGHGVMPLVYRVRSCTAFIVACG